jgi:hypothetical protein
MVIGPQGVIEGGRGVATTLVRGHDTVLGTHTRRRLRPTWSSFGAGCTGIPRSTYSCQGPSRRYWTRWTAWDWK